MLKESLKQTLQVAVESEEFQVAQQLIQILTSLKVEKKPVEPFQQKLFYEPLIPPDDNEPTFDIYDTLRNSRLGREGYLKERQTTQENPCCEVLLNVVSNSHNNEKCAKLPKRKVSDYRDAMLDLFTSDRWQSGNVTSRELYECLAKDFAKRWEDFPTEFESEKLSGGSARWVTYVSQVLGKDEQIRQCFRKPTNNKNMYIFRK